MTRESRRGRRPAGPTERPADLPPRALGSTRFSLCAPTRGRPVTKNAFSPSRGTCPPPPPRPTLCRCDSTVSLAVPAPSHRQRSPSKRLSRAPRAEELPTMAAGHRAPRRRQVTAKLGRRPPALAAPAWRRFCERRFPSQNRRPLCEPQRPRSAGRRAGTFSSPDVAKNLMSPPLDRIGFPHEMASAPVLN
jgi:hypothetical protein